MYVFILLIKRICYTNATQTYYHYRSNTLYHIKGYTSTIYTYNVHTDIGSNGSIHDVILPLTLPLLYYRYCYWSTKAGSSSTTATAAAAASIAACSAFNLASSASRALVAAAVALACSRLNARRTSMRLLMSAKG